MDDNFGQVVLVKDINPNNSYGYSDGSYPSNLVEFDDRLYFSANDGETGDELWVSNGTAEGTNLVADINSNNSYGYSDGSYPDSLVEFNDRLYFSANDGETGDELWVSNGTAEGTNLVADINSDDSSYPNEFTSLNGRLYFTADNGDGETGTELWVTNGTTEGTQLVADINPGIETYFDQRFGETIVRPYSSNPSELTEFNGKLYFSADNRETGRELWVTDGTTEGTQLVANISNYSSYDYASGSFPQDLTVFNQRLYFTVDTGGSNRELWLTDGTNEGTQASEVDLASFGFSPQNLTEFNGRLYFSLNDGTGEELWTTDGTNEGTQLVADINTSSNDYYGYSSSYPSNFVEFNNKLYFSADDGENGRELWVTDGTSEGTQLVADINPDGYSFPSDLTVVGDELFFNANNGSTGNELFKLTFDSANEPEEPINIIDGSNGKDNLVGTDDADEIDGGNGKDTIDGDAGNDTLIGGNGQDNLVGGIGDDSLVGGRGDDLFVIQAGQGSDTIADFDVGKDSIGLAGGLQYEALVFEGENIFSDDELLVTVEGVDTQQLSVDSFEVI